MVVGATTVRNLSSEIEESAKEKRPISSDKFNELKDQFEQLVNLLQNRYNLGFSRGM
jgi:hypothetical protein